ncbi:2-C-methyl-D-erythritol 4-phosphate cytidylyltransferase [Paeniglutamicibacter sp. NPDC012692]|uniref:2-C-methyl-D-erythritol 4-phosphate cytidylyltransferase n=1 Tax=Paeniglutamicibacter sp. NPDC012692 TaxID=3364388 RepID=UPI0036AE2192
MSAENPNSALPAQRTAIIVVAAGSGTRLGYGMPKALVPLNGRSLLEHALDRIAMADCAEEVIVVLPAGDSELAALCAGHELHPRTVNGGSTRNDSVRAGLSALGPGVEQVLIHDSARCLTPPEVFDSVAGALAAGATAVIPVLPVVDTIKTVSRDPGAEQPHVTGTPAREFLRAVQTPQGFHAATLIAAHAQADGWDKDRAEEITDDAMLMERLGERVDTVPGSPEALKITTPMDLLLAQSLLGSGTTEGATMNQPDEQPMQAVSPMLIPRTGIGIDVHAVADASEPRDMWLAGLHFPGVQGLSGHSDGDAVAHAACDALFSAAGIGDLGTHFGTDRPEYAGASGTALLAEAARLVREAGFEIGNVAVQFVGRRPKFAARRLEADAVLSKAAGAPVTVTATTSDGLGYEGTGEGLTAYATALVYSVKR